MHITGHYPNFNRLLGPIGEPGESPGALLLSIINMLLLIFRPITSRYSWCNRSKRIHRFSTTCIYTNEHNLLGKPGQPGASGEPGKLIVVGGGPTGPRGLPGLVIFDSNSLTIMLFCFRSDRVARKANRVSTEKMVQHLSLCNRLTHILILGLPGIDGPAGDIGIQGNRIVHK
jgi:hypothetical protein